MRIEHLGPPAVGDGAQAGAPNRNGLAGENVGVNEQCALALEERRDAGLSACDVAGETDEEHEFVGAGGCQSIVQGAATEGNAPALLKPSNNGPGAGRAVALLERDPWP